VVSGGYCLVATRDFNTEIANSIQRLDTGMTGMNVNRVECNECGLMVNSDAIHEAYDSYRRACEDCLEQCHECGYWLIYGVDDHNRYCDDCGDGFCAEVESYTYCHDCGETFCSNCRCRYHGSSQSIREYHDNPEYIRHGNDGDVSFGIEMEFDGCRDDIVSVVHRYDDSERFMWICKDGSLNSGAEVITHPMTLEFIRNYPFGDMLADMKNADTYTNDETGIHIHIGRDAFLKNGRHSMAHLARFIKFMYVNRDSAELIARRDSEEWAPFSRMGRDGYRGYNGTLTEKAQARSTDVRYCAINTTNRRTVEVRIFRTTYKGKDLMAAVEFCAAVVEYTRHRSAGISDAMAWPSFLAWLTDSGEYPALVAYLAAV
jgi:hypothetical protein